MYCFQSYKFIADMLISHGYDLPVSYNRSTLHRWRSAGRVPDDAFKLIYYYACSAFGSETSGVDIYLCLDALGFNTDGLECFYAFSKL